MLELDGDIELIADEDWILLAAALIAIAAWLAIAVCENGSCVPYSLPLAA